MGMPWYERPLNIIIHGALLFVVVLSCDICQSGGKSTGEENLTKDEKRAEQKPNRAAIPSFRITAKYEGLRIAYAVLVPKNINREQLKNLILEFRKAREEGSLSKMIPSTTLDNLRVDYNGVEIYVFSEPSWATESKFKKWMESSLLGAEAKVLDKQYVNHIKAYYFYSFPLDEEGFIGFSGEGVKSSDYESLFYNREAPDDTAKPCLSCGAEGKEPSNK